MNIEQLITKFQEQQKKVQTTIKLLREISRLDQNRYENLQKIRQAIEKLNHVLNSFEQGVIPVQALTNWISQYQSEVKRVEEKITKQFGVELENELGKLGLSLSGQYPELKAGLFTIQLDFDQWKVTLWYGPKQERLAQHPFSVRKITSQIEKQKQKLGSQLPEEQLLERLREAYHRASGMKHGGPVPIIKVLAEMSYLLQSSRFLQDPRRENYRSYSRADFSYDLFRIRKFQSNTLFTSKLHLTVATRAHTRRRSDFLWVPDDENGRGTTYSHMQIEEDTK